MGSARSLRLSSLLVLVFDPQTSYLLLEEDSPFFTGALEQSLGVFAAIYLIVHGLTNVEKDLPAKWREVWDRTFHPKPHVPPGPRESEVGAAMRERN
jgi:hypothetical protein